MNLYLAGPLFTTGEKLQNAALAKALRGHGYGVFLPQENEFQHDTAAAIFEGDRAGMLWADAIVACLDGPDPDSGTSWELGFMFALGKPALIYRTDFRTACGDFQGQPVNLMLSIPAKKYIHHIGGDMGLLGSLIHQELRHWSP